MFPDNLVSADAVASAFRTLYLAGGSVQAVTHVPRAFSHDVWLIDTATGRYALKVARWNPEPARLANAIACQRLVSAAGVRTSRILAWDDSALLGRPVHVQEWLPGQDAETAWSSMGVEEHTQFARDFGQALSVLHSILGPSFGSVTLNETAPSWSADLQSWLARNAQRIRRNRLLPPTFLDSAVARLHEGIAALSPDISPALTHWDLWLGNVLVEDGRFAALIDWESASFADPLVDFVRLETWVFDAHPETREPFLAAYWDRRGIPRDLDVRLDLYRGLVYLAHVYYCTNSGLLDEAAAYRVRLGHWLRSQSVAC